MIDQNKAKRLKRLRDMEAEEERRDAAQRRANRLMRSLPPNDEDEEIERMVADIRRLAGLAPEVPPDAQLYEGVEHADWDFMRVYLRDSQRTHNDMLRTLVRISVALEKLVAVEARHH